MNLNQLDISGVFLIEHDPYSDNRGEFYRSFCAEKLKSAGIPFSACQGNISKNFKKGTLRGFHYQKKGTSESKILSCITGSIYNVVVDLRKESLTYKRTVSLSLKAEDSMSLLVPGGCANAFLTMCDNTIVHYYMADYYDPDNYAGFCFNDPQFDIEWPFQPKVISSKDMNLPFYKND